MNAAACDMGFPVHVKPANMGSSVGVARCADREEPLAVAEHDFRYGEKVVVDWRFDSAKRAGAYWERARLGLGTYWVPHGRWAASCGMREDMVSELNEVGFERPKREPLAGTVKFYQRHLFVCTGTADWPAHIESAGGFTEALHTTLAAHAGELALAVKLNACDEPSRPGPMGAEAGVDVLVFPDHVRYLGLQWADIPVLVQDHLIGNRVAERLPHEPLTGQHIFVCGHAARDGRCGYCGPILAGLFEAEINRRGLQAGVYVHRTSHVGGHQFAGNVLIYPAGDWYGYVTPTDVPRLIEQHILQGAVVPHLWRGRMGLPSSYHTA